MQDYLVTFTFEDGRETKRVYPALNMEDAAMLATGGARLYGAKEAVITSPDGQETVKLSIFKSNR